MSYLQAFTFWALLEGIALLVLILIVKGTAFWEKSKNRPVSNAYLTGIVFLLFTLAIDNVYLNVRKEKANPPFVLTESITYIWYMPKLWIYLSILMIFFLFFLYFKGRIDENTKPILDLRVSELPQDLPDLKRAFIIWGLAGTIILIFTILIILKLLRWDSASYFGELIFIWGSMGTLVLLLILIVKGIGHWERSGDHPVRYAYLAGIVYLGSTIVLAIYVNSLRASILAGGRYGGDFSTRVLVGIHWIFLPLYWVIFAVIVCGYLALLLLKEEPEKLDSAHEIIKEKELVDHF